MLAQEGESTADVPVDAELHQLLPKLTEQRRRFQGLYDYLVPLDLTPPEEGFKDPAYGGPYLKNVLLESLPSAHRQTLLTLDRATHEDGSQQCDISHAPCKAAQSVQRLR